MKKMYLQIDLPLPSLKRVFFPNCSMLQEQRFFFSAVNRAMIQQMEPYTSKLAAHELQTIDIHVQI